MEPSIYCGPNLYSQHSVVRFTLETLQQHQGQNAAARGLEVLYGVLPGLLGHAGPCGTPGCFDHAGEGDAFPFEHLFEHICIELQNLAGAELECVRGRAAHHVGAGEAIVPYDEVRVCHEAGLWAEAFLASHLFAPPLPSASDTAALGDDQPTFDCAAHLETFLAYGRRKMLPVQDRAMIKTANALGIPATRLAGRKIMLGQGRFQQRLSATKTTHTDVVSNDLAANKDYARRVLGDLGLPIPKYQRVRGSRATVEAAREIGYPVVVKPNNGSMGEGVSVGMKNRREVKAAYRRARAFGRSVLVEEMVEGADYRLLVIDGKFHAASKRVPGHVVGNGKHTIEELVAEVNRDPRRGTGPTTSWTIIELDDQADRLLADMGYTRQSVPPEEEVVYLRRNANTSDGGTAADVTDEVHPDNRDIAVRTAMAIGLDIAGVDFLTTDISTSMWENGGKICEINSRPGIRKHIWPAEGKPRDVLTPIVRMLFPSGRQSRIPIAAVMGSGATELAAQMLAHILTEGGHHVGLAVGQRILSGGRPTAADELTAPAAARRVLLDPKVDVAVLEIDADDILRNGLGCDHLDVVAIVNAHDGQTATNTGDKSERERAGLALDVVARANPRAVLVGHGDRDGLHLEHAVAGAERYHIATDAQVRRPAAPGSPAARRVVCEDNAICIYDRSELRARVPLVEIRRQFLGEDAGAIMQSAVFASVTAYNLGQEPDHIYRSLLSFQPPPDLNRTQRCEKEVMA